MPPQPEGRQRFAAPGGVSRRRRWADIDSSSRLAWHHNSLARGPRAFCHGLLALVLWTFVTACASGSLPSPGRETREQIEELESRVLDLQRQATMNEVEIARLRQQVATLEARLGQGGRLGSAERGAATGSLRPSVPAEAPASLPVAVDEPVVAEEIEMPPVPRPVAPAEQHAPEAVERPATGLPTPVAPVEALDASGQALYDEAYTLYHQGRYPAAEAAFRSFLEAHPSAELSDNAQYWIGAARFATGDYPGALRAFREVVERYPEGNKVPDALYKIGQSLEAVGDPPGAREVYDEIRTRFPNTAAASLAADRLDALR